MYFHKKNMQSLGPACFGKSMNALSQLPKRGNFLLVTFWNAALIMGIFSVMGQ
jgi:hypothetical protein